ncbi:DNA methyltransferase [Candidatus Termititenax aidoneus]|uniref:DNA (cytosine-5-)-methyltransferase n=1 Tax=Termititenax aidoneus TaxID=2218524 RepID=A0A388TC00_TERA1|nr:DNA methyltransferase [Candidatus Termititenax aidoneus]
MRKLGSLFSGAGGFELCAKLSGIEPVWASEVERFPIAVTSKNFPGIKHLGDIKNINGAEVEPVDVIAFGSPCQDLSIAGKRVGLDGERSGLFAEAIRIVKEMRCASGGINPRFVIWENVPGAFSSNAGEDFRTVLEEIVRIKFPAVSIPRPSWGWTVSGLVVGDGFSVAWRMLDAQYWGVPQRRRRIYLAADFAGQSAGKILFECESLQGDIAPRSGTQKNTSANSRGSVEKTICFEPGSSSRVGGHSWNNLAGPLRANAGDNQLAIAIENHPADSRMRMSNKVQTLTSQMGTGGNNVPMTLKTYSIGSYNSEGMKSDNPKMSRDYKDPQNLVRRLTPMECGRLQGFPDGWCDGVPHSDMAEYKMWGNSLAIPCALFVIRRVAEMLNKNEEGEND